MSKGFKNAIKISITIKGIKDEEAKEIIDEIFKKYGNKLYFAHYGECKVLKK